MVLGFTDVKNPFVVFVDACMLRRCGRINDAKGENGNSAPSTICSRSFSKGVNHYSTIKQEAVTLILRLKMFRHYLLFGLFVIHSAHEVLWTAFSEIRRAR